MDLVEFTKYCVTLAEQKKSKLDQLNIIPVYGQSGTKNLNLMNNLNSIIGTNYLEIGLFNGLTFCSSLFLNSINAIGIDNWSEFGGTRSIFENNIKSFSGKNNVNIIEGDCFSKQTIEQVKNKLNNKKVKVYLYDGGHSEDEHYMAFSKYNELFDNKFICVIDDWQQLEVQRGTLFAIRDLKYNILWEKHCLGINDDKNGWWCGSYVAVLEKNF